MFLKEPLLYIEMPRYIATAASFLILCMIRNFAVENTMDTALTSVKPQFHGPP